MTETSSRPTRKLFIAAAGPGYRVLPQEVEVSVDANGRMIPGSLVDVLEVATEPAVRRKDKDKRR